MAKVTLKNIKKIYDKEVVAVQNFSLETGKTYIAELGYTPTLCATTSAGRFVVLPADTLSIGQSSQAKALNSSRARTIKVLTDKVAKPE